MYSIGEFSKINRITPKTLRHYDRIGLLKPDRVDDWTGYRYYSAGQLPEIRRILKLKFLGFSLDEIREIVQGTAQISQILQRQEQRLKEQLRETEIQIENVRNYLTQLEGGAFMNTQVMIKELPEVVVASMRTKVPGYDTYFDIVPKMGEYMQSVGAVCRVPEYCFTIYHDGEYRESDIDVEICEAVVAPCRESEKVQFKTIAGVAQAACIEHHGPYDTLRETYNYLFSWIEENGYKASDNPRESYIDGIWNRDNPNDWLTEVQLPVVRKEWLDE
jgi:DNA-binding transcriptional MerR regulator